MGAQERVKAASDLILNAQASREGSSAYVQVKQRRTRWYLNSSLQHILRPTIVPATSTASIGRVQTCLEGSHRGRIVKDGQVQHLTVGLIGLVNHDPRNRIGYRGDIEGVQGRSCSQIHDPHRHNARTWEQQADRRNGDGDVIHLAITHSYAPPHRSSRQRFNGLAIEA